MPKRKRGVMPYVLLAIYAYVVAVLLRAVAAWLAP